ncbi:MULTISPECIES: methyltransferase domain-containing protein [unclassified Cryobacterium]|uniref:class I SAM-dependent methyltransferase n=1 Tax=unclassified Cryobacterium TaxID=2649013 RepID=UPI001F544CC7|nr:MULTISPECIES: methyltransferase domain-containing protein [unclassified Cryobacterium]
METSQNRKPMGSLKTPTPVLKALAAQLGHPSGWRGRLVGRMLNRRNRGIIRAAVDALEATPDARLADVGFGGGVGIELLLDTVGPDGHVAGVDQSETMVDAAHRRFRDDLTAGRLSLFEASMEYLPLADASLDGVITLNTFYFLPDLGRAAAEFARVLRPGGRLVAGVFDPAAMQRMPVVEHGFRVRPTEEITSALEAAGLVQTRHLRVGHGPDAYHLLLASPAPARA